MKIEMKPLPPAYGEQTLCECGEPAAWTYSVGGMEWHACNDCKDELLEETDECPYKERGISPYVLNDVSIKRR